MSNQLVPYLLLLTFVLLAAISIVYLIPRAQPDVAVFSVVSTFLVALTAAVGCGLTGWLLLSGRATKGSIEAFFSIVLLGCVLWLLSYLLPKARRERDLFGVFCSVFAALLALVTWLLLGIGVGSR